LPGWENDEVFTKKIKGNDMEIRCTFAPAVFNAQAGKNVISTVFDAFVGEKRLVVGIAVGKPRGQKLIDAELSPFGQIMVARFGEYRDLCYPDSAVTVSMVASVGSAAQHVRDVLQDALDGSAIVFLCADNKVYDPAFDALNVDLTALPGNSQ